MAVFDATTALLQLLISGPSYGLELMEKLGSKTGGKFTLSQGATYTALRAMEADGLVTSYLGEEPIPERGGRPRRYFKLTAEGKRTAMQDRSVAGSLFELVPAKMRELIATFAPMVIR